MKAAWRRRRRRTTSGRRTGSAVDAVEPRIRLPPAQSPPRRPKRTTWSPSATTTSSTQCWRSSGTASSPQELPVSRQAVPPIGRPRVVDRGGVRRSSSSVRSSSSMTARLRGRGSYASDARWPERRCGAYCRHRWIASRMSANRSAPSGSHRHRVSESARGDLASQLRCGYDIDSAPNQLAQLLGDARDSQQLVAATR